MKYVKAILNLMLLGLAVAAIVAVTIVSVRGGWFLGNAIYHSLFGR